jgi:hypothetical protein
MDAFHQVEDGRAKEVAQQGVQQDVHEAAHSQAWQKTPERHAEHARGDHCRHP